ncbi:hypothetical protein B1R32_103166 [Abditibacterium utsteinense]|uniref:LTXXQ motif family protein n=1 Tax=Abditibacterium utsteinense TaxID=1960156 RepID=A0A2S8SVS7_9BACT|nr:hypothetical protein [Abditibacterium utsteinense]PQV64899.1 hypothetical protein B1R32_103166 [Abditibacterium utsteinense]
MKICLLPVLTVAGLSACLGTLSFAAPQGGPPQPRGDMHRGGMHPNGMRGPRGMGRMANELGLSEAQKTKLMAIMQSMQPQHEALRNNTSLSPAQKMTKMKAMRAAMEKKMNTVLTPAQRKKRDAMTKQFRDERRNQQLHDAL